MAYLTLFIGIALQFYFSSQMPDQIAIHFDTSSAPDIWASKGSTLIIAIVCYLFLTLTFMGCAKVFSSMSVEKMNIPNKEYWVQASHSSEVAHIYENWFSKLAVSSNVFLTVIFYILMKANKLAQPVIDLKTLYIIVGVYAVWTTWLCIDLILKFQKPKAT